MREVAKGNQGQKNGKEKEKEEAANLKRTLPHWGSQFVM